MPHLASIRCPRLMVLSTDPARSIAPGFTITPADAEKLAQEMAAPATARP